MQYIDPRLLMGMPFQGGLGNPFGFQGGGNLGGGSFGQHMIPPGMRPPSHLPMPFEGGGYGNPKMGGPMMNPGILPIGFGGINKLRMLHPGIGPRMPFNPVRPY